MIVSRVEAPSVDHTSGPVERRCLARRGMLHSECEAFDHVLLAPGAVVAGTGRAGADEAWLVLSGSVRTVPREDRGAERCGPGSLLLLGADRPHPELVADGREGARLLVLATLPAALAQLLPPRVPELVR